VVKGYHLLNLAQLFSSQIISLAMLRSLLAPRRLFTTTSTLLKEGRPPVIANINDLNVFDAFQQQQQQQQPNDTTSNLPVIQRCGRRGFTAANIKFRGGLMLVNGGLFLWDVSDARQLEPRHFSLLQALYPLPGTS